VNELRAQHDALLTRLSVRASTFHFAHAAVALFLSTIFGGAAWKLSLDVEYAWAPSLVLPAAIVSALAFVYGVTRLAMGRSVLTGEVREFEQLRALRSQLKLDEPNTFVAAP
jgi:hypothetical protein